MKNRLPSKKSSVWFETYRSGSHPEIQSIENNTYQFLKAVHSEQGTASTVNLLCNNSFCGFVRSYDGETENEPPHLELIIHPFKESCLGWLDKDEPIFGI
jgi:hypothetical protein